MRKLSMRENQLEALKILKEVCAICEENKFDYYLTWGTLIGAVRHQGFIPWDDDIDIMMPRPDYERFLEYCRTHEEQMKPYQLIHISTNAGYVYVLARVTNTEYKAEYSGVREYGLGTFIDVYPLDGLGKTYQAACKKMKKGTIVRKLIKLLEQDFYSKADGVFKNIFKYLAYRVARMIGRERLIRTMDRNCQRISYTESKYVGIPTVEIKIKSKGVLKKEWLEEKKYAKFEDEEFVIPGSYDKILEHCYGDYMKLPPEEQRIAHHFYSIYKKD